MGLSRNFRSFNLQVCATNALELGVDVGTLDATLHLGYPGSVASLWQQSGRAGRRITDRGSLSIYVGFGGPLDQYFMRDPKRLFGRPIENAQARGTAWALSPVLARLLFFPVLVGVSPRSGRKAALQATATYQEG